MVSGGLSICRENHKAVRNERFHRYLNKVETINTADKESFHQWLQGVLFALYAWNADPIDGTDVPRSFAVIGREFPLRHARVAGTAPTFAQHSRFRFFEKACAKALLISCLPSLAGRPLIRMG